MDKNAMASALWEAARAGDTAEASRLLDEGAPVDWKNDAAVSVEAVGSFPARCQRNGERCNQHTAFLTLDGLLRHEPRWKTWGVSTVQAIEPAAKRAACRWAASVTRRRS